ncbi:hypothetical protein Tco_0324965 [Tanacetum coccineum]
MTKSSRRKTRDIRILQDRDKEQTPKKKRLNLEEAKRARTEKSLEPNFFSCMVENEHTSCREATTSSEWLNPSIKEPIFSLNSLTIKPIVSDISVEMKEFLQLSFKFLEMPNAGDDALNTIVNSLASAVTTYSTKRLQFANKSHELVDNGGSYLDFSQVRKELFDIYNSILTTSGSSPAQRS